MSYFVQTVMRKTVLFCFSGFSHGLPLILSGCVVGGAGAFACVNVGSYTRGALHVDLF